MSDGEWLRYAYELARERGFTEAGAQMAVAQGWAESNLGVRKPFLLPSGEPSFNWGATTAKSGVPYFGGGDTDAAGKPITQRWAKWSSMAEGLDYWLSFGSVKAGLQSMQEGDATTYAAVIFDRGYYTGVNCDRETCIRRYAVWLRDVARDKVASALGMPSLVSDAEPVPASTGGIKQGTLPQKQKSGIGPVQIAVGTGLAYLAWKVLR